jgi:hypothetical protein
MENRSIRVLSSVLMQSLLIVRTVQLDKDTFSTVNLKRFVVAVMITRRLMIEYLRLKDQTYTNFQLTMEFSVSLHTTTQSKKESV